MPKLFTILKFEPKHRYVVRTARYLLCRLDELLVAILRSHLSARLLLLLGRALIAGKYWSNEHEDASNDHEHST